MTSKIMVYMLAENAVGDKVFVKTLVRTGGTDESAEWTRAQNLASNQGYLVHGCFSKRNELAFAAIDDSQCLELFE